MKIQLTERGKWVVAVLANLVFWGSLYGAYVLSPVG